MITNQKIDEWYERREIPVIKEGKKSFYMCDYCRIGILIKSNSKDQDGGEVILPASLIGRGKVKIVTHNSCIKKLVQEIEQMKKLV